MDIETNTQDVAQVSFTWQGGRGSITLVADGLDIDTAAGIVAAGLEAGDYTITRERVNARQVRDRRKGK